MSVHLKGIGILVCCSIAVVVLTDAFLAQLAQLG